MKTINVKHLGFDLLLVGEVPVHTLEEGAKEYGGATQYHDRIVSNVWESGNLVDVYEGNNTIGLFIPSTVEGNRKINNIGHVEKYLYVLQAHYPTRAFQIENVRGSWYSEKLDEVIVEKITVISMNVDEITVEDIATFKAIAEHVKVDMTQEGVSIAFNGALAIV